jgi:hypothetical protein
MDHEDPSKQNCHDEPCLDEDQIWLLVILNLFQDLFVLSLHPDMGKPLFKASDGD